MSDGTERIVIMLIGCLFVGLAGSVLSAFWYRATRGAWPDKDSLIVFAKIFFGIGMFGVVVFLLIRYG